MPEADNRVEVFFKKTCSESFRKFHRKAPVLESLFSEAAGLTPILRNNCFCTALPPLIVTYPFYFIFSTFLIITAITVNISDVFLVQIQKA